MTDRVRAVTVLQARMGSGRLPGKVLSPIGGWPLLHYSVTRALAAGVGEVLIATTSRPDDDAIATVGRQLGVGVLRGPVDDVLGRFVMAANACPDVDVVIRATADNPFADIGSAARLLKAMGEDADYGVEEGLPVGCAVEGMRIGALLEAARRAQSPYDREHVTPWLKRSPSVRRVAPRAPDACVATDLRLTVDTRADLQSVRQVAAVLAAQGWDARVAPLPAVIEAARTCAAEDVA
jgi:spore coat polysaccharide biosynthesis protein SpsF